MPQDKSRIPQAGETVYLKGDSKSTAMYLERVYTKDKTDYGLCSWSEFELFDDELLKHAHEKEFLLSDLTVYAPGTK